MNHFFEMSPPNILIITADDMSADSPGCFGGKVPEITPVLDQLAAGGMRFECAHGNCAVCAPSRSVWLTGLYPHRNGCQGFGMVSPTVDTLPEILARHGYLTGIVDKVGHSARKETTTWASVIKDAGAETGFGRNPSLFGKHAGSFMERAKRAEKPFFLLVNSRDPHRPFSGSRQERRYLNGKQKSLAHLVANPSRTYQPDEIEVPGFLPDLPEIREELANYFSSVRRCDDTIGAVLAALELNGATENTLTIFISDHGMPFPWAKFNCYPFSTRTPLVMHWPGRVRPGSVVSDSFVSGIDLFPTILEAVGIPLPNDIHGRSFLPLLEGKRHGHRERVVTVFHENQVNERLEMRSIIERRFGYIYNAWSGNGEQFQDETGKGMALEAMIRAGRTDPEIARRVLFFLFRAPEELYDYQVDPWALHNLADDPEQADRLGCFRGEMATWMRRYEDPLTEKYEEVLAHGIRYIDPQQEGLVKRCRTRY